MDKESFRVLLALAGAVLGFVAAQQVNEKYGFWKPVYYRTGVWIGNQPVTREGEGCGCYVVIIGIILGLLLAVGLSVAILGEPPKAGPVKPEPIVPPEAPAPPPVDPAPVDPSAAQVRDEIKKALGRHGTFNGEVWTTIVLRRFRDNSGRDVVEEQILAVQGLDVSCKSFALTEAGRRDGYEWLVEAVLTASSHRYLRLDGTIAQGSSIGFPPEMQKRFRACKKSGTVCWDDGSPSIRPTSDQSDIMDAILQAMQSPKTLPASRQAIRHIVRILDAGQAEGRKAQRAAGDVATRHLRVVDALSVIDLEGCPPDVVKVYRDHIQAWRGNDADRINATFEELMRRARRYGVGTASYRS